MTEINEKTESIKAKIKGGLIISFEAMPELPMGAPEFTAAIAKTAEMFGAVGARVDSPDYIAAVNAACTLPIFGHYKQHIGESEVHITPTIESVRQIASGSSAIAIDTTLRERPNGESVTEICRAIREDFKLPIAADIATFDDAVRSVEEYGASFVATTISGYTRETMPTPIEPDFALVERLAKRLSVPVFGEGRINSPEHARIAFECGAFAVVVGNAVTSIHHIVKQFVKACPSGS